MLTDVDWAVVPDKRRPSPSTPEVQKGVGLRPTNFQRPFATRMSPLAISADESVAAVARYNSSEREKSDLQIVNLQTGKLIASIDLPISGIKIVAISPDGKTIATSQGGIGSRIARTDFFEIGPEGLKHMFGWDLEGLAMASFLDSDRFLTVSEAGSITVWDWVNSRALSLIQTGRSNGASLSANNRLLAVHQDKTIFIIDLAARRTVGSIPYPAFHNAAFAFSPSGTRLAAVYRSDLTIWDLTNEDKPPKQMSILGQHIASAIEWIDENFLLVGHQSLVSVPLQLVVWNYSGGQPVRGTQNRYWYAVKDREGDGGSVLSFQMPNAGLVKAVEDLESEELAVLRPGMEISLNFDLPFNPAEKRKIRTAIEKNLEQNGFSVVRGDADIQLTASVVEGNQQSHKYGDFRMSPFRRGGKEVKYTPTTSSIVITKNGLAVWTSRTNNSPPPVIYSSDDEESIQETVDKHCAPKPAFFMGANLPKSLNRLPGGKAWLGQTKLTSSGPR